MKRYLCLFAFLLLPTIGFAQFGTLTSGAPTPALALQPSFPTPGQLVNVSFDDSRSAASGARLRWSYNNVPLPSAENARAIQLIAPPVGQSGIVKLKLEKDGLTETYQAVIKPLYVDIIVEPLTHVPAFYLGRALPSIGSQIKAQVLLNNGKALGTNYIYTWRINDDVYSGGALRGVNKILFSMPQGSSATLSVEVKTEAGVIIAKRTIAIPQAKPELYFYEVNTLFGLEPKALTRDFNLIANSALLRAEPYNLDSFVFNRPGILAWEINQKPAVSGEANPYEITLERTGNSGNSNLGFQVRSLTQLLQGVEADILIRI